MAKVNTLTVDNLSTSDHTETSSHGHKRHSAMNSDCPGTQTTNPSIRRMSRMEPRASVQYARRMSMTSRTSITSSSLANRQFGMYPQKVQNTYKLGPDPGEKFKKGVVENVIQEVLDECLDGEKYNPNQCRNLSQMLTDLIKNRVKDMCFKRYKYIVTVTIGQDSKQSMRVVSRFLWNDKTDNYATASYNKEGLYAVATVYACYFD